MINKKRILLLLVVLYGSLMTVASHKYYPPSIEGKSGDALKAILHNHISIHAVVASNNIWTLLKSTDMRADGSVWSIYTNDLIPFPDSDNSVFMDIDRLVNTSWSGDKYPFSHDLSYDMHHITPAPADVITHKRDYPVGELTEVLYTNGVWSVGYAMLLGTKVNAFEPADEYKGDVARMMMYVATCYSHYNWQSLATNIFSGGAYPTLNSYSCELLLQWHRKDPVSEKEIARNEAVFKIQGNRNPFVDYPIIAEHIWGNKMDTGFEFDNNDEDNPEEVLVPLRSKYRISDLRIDLYSPYIPENVMWRVNGVEFTQKFIDPKELGVGTHELQYMGDGVKGRVLIKIEP